MPTSTFNFTGASQSWVVPAGVTKVTIEAWGAEAGDGYGTGYVPGKGGYATGVLAVTPGETLHIYVGGRGTSSGDATLDGGWNGGGQRGGEGGGGPRGGGAGGGGTDVRQGGTALSNRKIVAGGGGGDGNNGAGGNGGGTSGDAGGGSAPGGGGTQTSGGAAGSADYDTASNRTAGSLGLGGNGNHWYGGGGGGGYYGGGGASSGSGGGDGGGGGSGYIGGVTSGSMQVGIRSGHGLATITYNEPPTAPGAFTDPIAGEVHNNEVPYAHGASSDPEAAFSHYERQYTTDNGSTWTPLPNATTTSGTLDSTSWPSTTTAKIRVRGVDTTGNYSAWTESPLFTIQHNVAPNAPPIVGPKNNQIIDRTQEQVFDWEFSDNDAGDSQSQFQRRFRLAGATTWTEEAAVTSTATQLTDPANFWAAGDWEWQVRTADQLVWGPYSASAFFTAANPPAAPSITEPANGATISTQDGQVAWSTPSQSSFQVRKVADNAGTPDATVVYYDSGEVASATARNHALSFPVNNRTEHIQVRIKDLGVWSAWASVLVNVSYTPPTVPTFALSPLSESGLIRALIDNGAWPVSVGTVTYVGTGTGTITGPTATNGVTQSHSWTATLVTTAANGGTFDVAVDGTVVGQAVVGAQFTYEGLSFTINDGATDFVVGDKFSWITSAVKTNSNQIFRRKSGESAWVRIAIEVPTNGTYDDAGVRSKAEYDYFVRAIGDNGTSSDSAILTSSVTLRYSWVHRVNDPAGTLRQFQYNNTGGSETHVPELEFLEFAGRKYPVPEFGEHEEDSVSVTLELAEDGDIAYMRELIRERTILCYRDSSGRKLFGIMPQQSIDSRFYGGTTTLELRAVDYSEEV